MSKYLRKSWEPEIPKTDKETENLSDAFEREVVANAVGSIAVVLRTREPTLRNPYPVQQNRAKHQQPFPKPPEVTNPPPKPRGVAKETLAKRHGRPRPGALVF